MTREAALLVMVAVAFVLLGLMVWGWRRRARRDSALRAPFGELPAGAVARGRFEGFYVATTAHDAPLDRLVIRGLGFRSRAAIAVADAGVVLDIPGQDRIVIPADRIDSVSQSTVAIDRVVEREGLTRLVWRVDADRLVDTFLRPLDGSARALADAIRPIVPARAPAAQSGTDA